MRKKILHVVEALGGGIYSYFLDMSKALGDDPDIELVLVYNDSRKEVDPEKVRTELQPYFRLIRLDMPQEISPSKDLKAALQLRKIFQEEHPSVIHLHSSKAGAIGRLAYFLGREQAPLFYTPHGYSFLRKDVSPKKRQMFLYLEKSLTKLFGGLTIACGDTELENAEAHIGQALLVRNGINPDEIRRHYRPPSNEKLTVGILGRITYARNPEFFNKVAKAFPDIQFKWIGDGELRDVLDAPNITITGWFTEREEGLKQLNTLDIYFQPSLWEGLPISVLEAMTLEKPVIASHIIGNKDVVDHGTTGYLFNTPEEVDEYIGLLRDPARREAMGKAGLARICERFDSRKNFRQLKALYLGHAGGEAL